MPRNEKTELKKLSATLDERILFIEVLMNSKYYSSFPFDHRQNIAQWLEGSKSFQRWISEKRGDDVDLNDLKWRLYESYESRINISDPRIKILHGLIVEQKRIMDAYGLSEDKSAQHAYGDYKIMTEIFNPVRSIQSTIANYRAIEIGKLAKEISDDIQQNKYLAEEAKSGKRNDLYLKLNSLSEKMRGTTHTSQLFRRSTGKNNIRNLAESIKPKRSLKEKIMNTFKRPGK